MSLSPYEYQRRIDEQAEFESITQEVFNEIMDYLKEQLSDLPHGLDYTDVISDETVWDIAERIVLKKREEALEEQAISAYEDRMRWRDLM